MKKLQYDKVHEKATWYHPPETGLNNGTTTQYDEWMKIIRKLESIYFTIVDTVGSNLEFNDLELFRRADTLRQVTEERRNRDCPVCLDPFSRKLWQRRKGKESRNWPRLDRQQHHHHGVLVWASAEHHWVVRQELQFFLPQLLQIRLQRLHHPQNIL